MIVVQSPSQIPKFLLRLRKFAKEKFQTYFKKKIIIKRWENSWKNFFLEMIKISPLSKTTKKSQFLVSMIKIKQFQIRPVDT